MSILNKIITKNAPPIRNAPVPEIDCTVLTLKRTKILKRFGLLQLFVIKYCAKKHLNTHSSLFHFAFDLC